MRLSLLSLLLLSSAALSSPAAADPPTEQAAEPAPAPSRPTRAERPARVDADSPRPRMERSERQPRAVADVPERSQRAERQVVPPSAPRAVAVASPDSGQRSERRGRVEPVRQRDGAAAGWQSPERSGERRSRARDLPPTAGSPVFGAAIPAPRTTIEPPRTVSPRSVTARDLRDRIAAEGVRRDRVERGEWRRDWRQDRRYDWRRHRDRDRVRFQLGIYLDPFGSRYRDYDIGWRLPARYYASRYWLNDPWSYRLPPVAAYYRWVRYYDDVLLVDLRTGRVVDRIRDFFW